MTGQNFRRWVSLLAAGVVCGAGLPGLLQASNAYLVRGLVSDIPGLADHTDPNLIGSWGVTASATSPFWISDAGSGLSTLYNSTGAIIPLVVTIPPSKGGGKAGAPTGVVFNGTTDFAVASGNAAAFIFATLDGSISGWNSTVDRTHSIIKVDNSSSGAIYTGLAIGSSNSKSYLYAANFHGGTIDVFDATYAPVVMPFSDPMLPAGFAPFNIQNLGGKLYVAYGMQNAAKQFVQPGAGLGYVDVFDTAGNLLQRLIAGGQLNAPWGLAIAPTGFGDFAGDLLVGNFGDGTINVFNPSTGVNVATLHDVYGSPIVVPGLWALQPGNGGNGGETSSVYFTAGIPGPDNGTHGLFGRLQGAPAITANSVVNGGSFLPGIAPNTWVTIKGANLASTTRTWDAGDFVNGALPAELDGVSVTLNGKPAYVAYASPTQINILTPVATPVGPVQVLTINGGLTSGSVTAQVQSVAPAFFLRSDGKQVAATHTDGTAVGPTSPAPNASTPAKPGETITLWGTGFGPTTPEPPDGQLLTTPTMLTTTPIITFNGATAQVTFAGLTAAGLDQINVTIPATTPDGDIPVVALVGTATSQSGAIITVQH